MGIWIKWYLPRKFERLFPSLTRDVYRALTVFPTKKYNCIAYAAGDKTKWWWPDPYGQYYWPINAPRDENVPAFVLMFGLFGYSEIGNASSEPDLEHVAIYFDRIGTPPFTFPGMPTHAARQMTNGRWRSKLGAGRLIEHTTLECLNGSFPAYGEPIKTLRRRRAKKPGFWSRALDFFGDSFLRLL